MGLNLKRMLIVSFLNYFIRKSLKSLDYNLIETDHIRGNLIYSCTSCDSIFSEIFLCKNISVCPVCSNALLYANDSFNI